MVSEKLDSSLYSSKFLEECLNEEVFKYSNEIKNPIRKIIHRVLLRMLRPNTHILYMVRKMQYNYHRGGRLWRLYALYLHKRIWNESGCYISPLAIIAKGLDLPHPSGIVIGGAARIGANVTIYQNVTIGSRRKGDFQNGDQPTIEDGVICYSNSQLLGPIIIGKNSVIGASSVVLCSVPTGHVVAGNPAKSVNILSRTHDKS